MMDGPSSHDIQEGASLLFTSAVRFITASKLTELYGAPIEVLRTGDGRLVVVGEPEAPHHHGHRHDE
jgi:zinc/manganese transport system ATP-binding protein